MREAETIHSSFRDPSGFIFKKDGVIYRQINKSYQDEYDYLINSGLYQRLLKDNLLIKHKESSTTSNINNNLSYKIIVPELIPFISYPYEWSFSMLKDAALTTLRIHKISIEYGMSLKDASAYNIQFIGSQPRFIDTLSFEKYDEGKPWVAYQQFCKHFLAPLALMSYCSTELSKLSCVFIDGVDLSLTSKLLPLNSRLNAGILLHIFAHAKSQQVHKSDGKQKKLSNTIGVLSKTAMLGLIDSLESTIKNLKWRLPITEWGNYYEGTNYSDEAMVKKMAQVESMIKKTKAKILWDLGGNTGKFSRLASANNIYTISFDIDPVAVELNYLESKKDNEKLLLPLVIDLTNPSPSIGFSHNERDSLLQRGQVDTVLALALIHHLVISNNLPFDKIAEFLSKCGKWLIIEFIPKNDSQMKILLSSRKDIFSSYNIDNFKDVFLKYFDIVDEQKIQGTQRTLFIMKK